MRKLMIVALGLFTLGCSKSDIAVIKEPVNNFSKFTEYMIAKGEHESNHGYEYVKLDTLAFTVVFNQSARYTNADPINQLDINKLYGFCDNDQEHHKYSARFGWNYMNNELQLFGYTYNDGVRSSRLIRSVPLEQEIRCGIVARGNTYIFRVGNDSIQMPRMAATPKAQGYKLYPYFGGDETAPQPIKILIRNDPALL